MGRRRALGIQDGSQITESIDNFAGFTDTHVVPKTIQGFMSTYETSKSPAIMAALPTLPHVENPRWQPSGSSNISETMTHIIKIPTANLRHSTMSNSQEVYLGDFNNDRLSEMAAETGNTYISYTKFQRQIWGIRPGMAGK